MAQISIPVEYSVAPNNIYGALYQRVTTYLEYGLTGSENVLASPKSAILRTSPLSIKRLAGLRSL